MCPGAERRGASNAILVVKAIAPLVSEVSEVSDFLLSSYACTHASFAIERMFLSGL
jgi:hypothetical protein